MSKDAILPYDGRDEYQRMGRRDVWRALKNAEIPFKPGCTTEDGIKLLQANQINPMDAIEWEQVQVKDEKGNIQIQNHPKRTEPNYSEAELMKREEEMQRRLEVAVQAEKVTSEKTDALETKFQELTEQVALLTQALLKQKTPKPKITDPHKMPWLSFKKWCKERGYELTKGEKRAEVIAKLEPEAPDEDTAERS